MAFKELFFIVYGAKAMPQDMETLNIYIFKNVFWEVISIQFGENGLWNTKGSELALKSTARPNQAETAWPAACEMASLLIWASLTWNLLNP